MVRSQDQQHTRRSVWVWCHLHFSNFTDPTFVVKGDLRIAEPLIVLIRKKGVWVLNIIVLSYQYWRTFYSIIFVDRTRGPAIPSCKATSQDDGERQVHLLLPTDQAMVHLFAQYPRTHRRSTQVWQLYLWPVYGRFDFIWRAFYKLRRGHWGRLLPSISRHRQTFSRPLADVVLRLTPAVKPTIFYCIVCYLVSSSLIPFFSMLILADALTGHRTSEMIWKLRPI